MVMMMVGVDDDKRHQKKEDDEMNISVLDFAWIEIESRKRRAAMSKVETKEEKQQMKHKKLYNAMQSNGMACLMK